MKTLLLFLLVSLKINFLEAQDASENLARFSIDKKIYDNFSDSQRNALLLKNQELLAFIENDIKKQIPENILDKIKNLKIKTSLTEVPGRDGLFVPSENGEHTISIQLIQMHSNGIKALLAHEIYHAIHYHLNPNELPWVREGMAQLFEYIATGELNGMNLKAAVENPLTPLLGRYSPELSNRAQYGHNMLYFFYLYNQCGGKEFFWKMTEGNFKKNIKGSLLIDSVLEELNYPTGQCSNFAESATFFEVAKIHNKIQFTAASEQQKYYVFPGDIKPVFQKISGSDELKKTLEQLPALSSFKMPFADYLKFEGECHECALFYLQENFPYQVVENPPMKKEDYDVVLVKLKSSNKK